MSKVIEAAEEFVETMTDTQSAETEVECGQNGEGSNGSESSMAMEERKARMEKLRQKMVRYMHTMLRFNDPRHIPALLRSCESGTSGRGKCESEVHSAGSCTNGPTTEAR